MKRVLIILLALASVIPAGAKNRSIYHKNSSIEKRRLSIMDMNEKGKVGGGSFEDRARSEAYAAWLSGMNGIHTYNIDECSNELFHQLGDPAFLWMEYSH